MNRLADWLVAALVGAAVTMGALHLAGYRDVAASSSEWDTYACASARFDGASRDLLIEKGCTR